MTCETYEEQTSALIDHELNDAETEMLFVHLSTCRTCRHSLQSVLDLRSGLTEQVPPMAPKELDEKVMKRTARAQRAKVDRPAIRGLAWQGRISAPMPVAAGIVLLLMIGSFLLSTVWSGSMQRSAKEDPQLVYLTVVPTVEVRAYNLEPTTITQ
jgi:anti-sigma factor RsiW